MQFLGMKTSRPRCNAVKAAGYLGFGDIHSLTDAKAGLIRGKAGHETIGMMLSDMILNGAIRLRSRTAVTTL